MKRILCYGDSNTWGWNPKDKSRHDSFTRWTGRLQNMLGQDYTIIEEGLNGRTITSDDNVSGGGKNGLSYLVPCLESHRPIDIVILMLGTNDMKVRFSLSAYDITKALLRLINVIKTSQSAKNSAAPDILLMSPPIIGNLSEFKEMFSGAKEKSEKLPKYYQQLAHETGCEFLETGKFIESSSIDGIHLEEVMHSRLAEQVFLKLKAIENKNALGV